jgi:photosystem II stability/assembly factor-like uncharacterized protein
MIRILALCCFALLAGRAVAEPMWPNVQVSAPGTQDPEEVAIAINPTDPQNVFAASNIAWIYRSIDGGQTWTTDELTSSHGVWGDPVVLFDRSGNLYHSHLSYPRQVSGDWLDRIVIQKSTDNGVTFNDGSWIGLAPPKDQDKEWMAVDTTAGVHDGNLYIAWTEFDRYGSTVLTDSTRILFSRSTDGASTWMPPVRVSDEGGNCIDEDETVEGAVPAVGPNGEIYMAWAGHDQIWFDASYDGGLSWGADTVIATQPGGWAIDVPGIYRCNGMPVTLCDTTSPRAGNIYVVFSDQREGLDDTDIWFLRSSDGGQTWTSPANPVPENGAHHQFFPWATIDPVTGYLYLVYYDRRNTTGEFTDVYMSMSADGGDSWSEYQISESSFIPESHIFFGDYTNIAALDGRVYPIWMRMDGGELSIWTALVEIQPSAAPETPVTRLVLRQNRPNPFNPVTSIDFVLPEAVKASLKVYDLAGTHIVTLIDRPLAAGPHFAQWDGRDGRGQRVSSGVYLYELQAGDQSVTRKMTLVK